MASLGIRQDLANEVHETLHFEGVSLFFSLYHLRGGRDVERKLFPIDQRDQDWGLRQKPLDRVKRLLGLGSPFKTVDLLQKPIEGEIPFAEARDEAAGCGEAPYNSLYPLYVLNRAHPCDGRDLLWVGFDAMLEDNEAQ